MVMDENGRNGWNWHLAQQLAQHVIIQKQQTTQPVIRYVLSSISCDHDYHIDMGGDFHFSYKYQKFSPYPIIIIYNLLTNRWLEYGII